MSQWYLIDPGGEMDPVPFDPPQSFVRLTETGVHGLRCLETPCLACRTELADTCCACLPDECLKAGASGCYFGAAT